MGMDEALRLFVAIDLPEAVRHSLQSLCHGIEGVRWTPPHQLHLTLRFIGSVDRERFSRIRSELTTVVTEPITLTLNGVGSFPVTGPPRVLWTGVGRSDSLRLLRDNIEQCLQSAGCDAEARPFSPHITLARLKDVPRNRIVPYLSRHTAFSEGPICVKEFHLYSSRLSREGSHHTVERSYSFASDAMECSRIHSGDPESAPCSSSEK